MEEGSGTRTSLIFEVARVIEQTPEEDRPVYLLGENVPDIVNKKNLKHLMRFVQRMSNLGYSCRYSLLNAKDFGVPQNRERCFMIFSRIGITEFPKGWALDKCLEDVLEEKVDGKYYLSQKAMDGFVFHRKKQSENGVIQGCDQVADLNRGGYESTNRVYSTKGCSPTINTYQGGQTQAKILIRNNTKLGYIEAESGDGIILDQPNSNTKRERVQRGMSPTIMTSGQVGVIIIDGESYSIRHLTPRECFRLFGFTEEQIDRVFSLVIGKKNISNCTLYKIAGNSIVVPVLSEIFKTMYGKQSPTLFDF